MNTEIDQLFTYVSETEQAMNEAFEAYEEAKAYDDNAAQQAFLTRSREAYEAAKTAHETAAAYEAPALNLKIQAGESAQAAVVSAYEA